jgi:hypothetical protein
VREAKYYGKSPTTMKPTVYVETSIFGYLAMRGSSLLLVAANQQITRDWWDKRRDGHDLFVSLYVLDECTAGDPVAAQERLVYPEGIPLLETSDEVDSLTATLLRRVPLPKKAGMDAFHISITAVRGIEFLLTWNCKHIANPALRKRIELIGREEGYDPPVICTPQEIMETDYEF